MSNECSACHFEKVYELQFRGVNQDLSELNERVKRVETVLARGVFLLVTNLAVVVITLAQLVLAG
ncbi:MAG: hypothetical protein KJ052_03190 [Candidatus Hydrogenedentes bacterium]|nr:hypothetical protein [Candidatus Hydrogenedentota bacterium]